MNTDYEDDKITRRYMPDIIRRYRDAAGFSQQKLADYLGVSKGFISGLEGGRSIPNIDMLIRIARALGADSGEMLNAMIKESEKD